MEINEFISKIETEKPSNITKVFFSRKNTNGNKYITHQPSVSNAVQYSILETILPFIKSQLNNNIVPYNPVGTIDGSIEKLGIASVEGLRKFQESLSEDKLNIDMSTMRIDKIGFYCIRIQINDDIMFIFRQFQKLVKLRKGLLTRLIDNELNTTESDFLGIDEFTDIIVYSDDMYILNHIGLERIFNYKDVFLNNTNTALSEIENKNVILNFDQFTDDCRKDVRIMKRFTSIMANGRLPLFFENYDKVPSIVEELGLDIEFDEDKKLIYREKSQLFHIINLLSDAYFKSLLAQRPGVAMIEGEI